MELCVFVNIVFFFDIIFLVVINDVMLIGVKGDKDCVLDFIMVGDVYELWGEGVGNVCNMVLVEILKVNL